MRAAVTLSFLLLAPAFASADELEPLANEFTEARYEVSESDISLVLLSKTTPGASRVRVRKGVIRVWFEKMAGDVFLDPPVDGHAVKWIRVRPGAAGSAIIKIRLGDNRRLPTEAVRLVHGHDGVRINVSRSMLPIIPPPQVHVPPEAQVPTEPAAEADPAASAPEPEDKPEEATAAPAIESPREDDDAAKSTAVAPAPTKNGARPRKSKSRKGKNRKSKSSPIPADANFGAGILVLICVLLGGIYGVIRLLQKRKMVLSPQSAIEIVSSKRLGGKHQLILIRALGEDHLLSVNAGRTELITSTAIGAASMPAPEMAEQNIPAENSGLLARIHDRLNPTRRALAMASPESSMPPPEAEPAPPAPAPPPPRSSGGPPQFGSELLRFAANKTESPPPDQGELNQAAAESAVAGIIRLRERFGR